MSYDENDAARDAFYEQIGNEAIADFTADRLKSYYDDHFDVMQPALRTLHEATRLRTDGHPSAAIVFAASAIELFLKATILTNSDDDAGVVQSVIEVLRRELFEIDSIVGHESQVL